MITRYSFLFTLLMLAGCIKNDPEIPAGIIEPDSMISILSDIHIAESRLIQDGYKPDNPTFKKEYMELVLQRTGVDSTRFNKSFLFYSSYPDFFQSMYEDVIIEISKEQAKSK